MLDYAQIISEIRLCVGRPSPQVVSDEVLERYYNRALKRLAGELGWLIPLDPIQIHLTANQYSYPLPEPVMQVLWVAYGTAPMLQIAPDNVMRWIRDNQGWMNQAASSPPASFAIMGRNLLLNPPPAQDTTSADTLLQVGYIADSPGLQARGVAGLPDSDCLTAVYDAGSEFLAFNPGTTEAEQAVRAALVAPNAAFYQRHLNQSREDWDQQAKFAQRRIAVGGRRTIAAR